MTEITQAIPKYKNFTSKHKAQKILTISTIKEYASSLDNKNIVSCYLFGSYSKNRANLLSDIDFLFLFNELKYTDIEKIINMYKEYFFTQGYICNPIYSYKKYLKNDNNILIRQYIKDGILLFGDDIKLPYESDEELKQKEYEDYWKANYLRKVSQLKIIFDQGDDIQNDGLYEWQYIYLILYWYAKAELTLIDKQYSLNEYTLQYIYQKLLKTDLDQNKIAFLNLADKYRDYFYREEAYGEVIENPKEYCDLLLELIIGGAVTQ